MKRAEKKISKSRNTSIKLFTLVATMIIIVMGLIIGCSNELLDSPKRNDGAKTQGSGDVKEESDTNDTLVDLLNLKATHGKKQEITLSWDYVSGVAKYRIYSSATPYAENGKDAFVLEREISAIKEENIKDSDGNSTTKKVFVTSCDIAVDTGAARYYKIVAHKKNKANGTVGDIIDTSNIVYGTSLAAPIMSITAKDKSAIVQWFMDNCDTATYKNHVVYEITIYEDAKGEKEVTSVTIKGADLKDENSHTFNDLIAGSTYYYEVKAYLDTAFDEIETSGIMNKEMAESIIPSAVDNFVATRGEYSNEVHISWTLPPFVNIRDGAEFKKRPVYFVLQRKRDDGRDSYDGDERGWTTIASYIGTQRSRKNELYADNKNITPLDEKRVNSEKTETNWFFNCELAKAASWDSTTTLERGNDVEVFVRNGSSGAAPANCEMRAWCVDKDKYNADMQCSTYSRYVYGSKITYIDKVVNVDGAITRGSKYVYRVISKTDDESKEVTGPDKPWARGFSAAQAYLHFDATSDVEEDKTHAEPNRDITSWDIELNMDFDAQGVDYKYLLLRSYANIEQKADADGTNKVGDYGPWNYVDCLTDDCKEDAHRAAAFYASVEAFNSKDNIIPNCGFDKCYYKNYKVADFKKAHGSMANISYKMVILTGAVTIDDIASNIGKITQLAKGDAAGTGEDPAVLGSSDKRVVDIITSDSDGCVVDSEKYLPRIKYYTMEDGYSDKYIAYFEYNDSYTYYVNYVACKNGVELPGETGSFKIPKGSYKDTNFYDDNGAVIASSTISKVTKDSLNCVKLVLPATSGDERKYKLSVKSGITKIYDFYEEGHQDDADKKLIFAQTLGTAHPTQEVLCYDKIIITWPYVTKSNDNFDIAMYYADDYAEDEAGKVTTDAARNLAAVKDFKINGTGYDTVYTCTVEKPTGYDDAARSGKKIITRVVARSDRYSDAASDGVTISKTDTYILGPAAINTRVSVPSNTEMKIEWDTFPVDSIKKYAVYRASYTDVAATTFDTDKEKNKVPSLQYIVEKNDKGNYSIECTDDTLDCTYAANVYTRHDDESGHDYLVLSDSYNDVKSDANCNKFRNSQNRIVLGVPYAYFVMPVIDAGDVEFSTTASDIGCEIKGAVIDEINRGSVTYGNMGNALIKNATTGCARELKASKLESNEKITITWDPPYWAGMGSSDVPDVIGVSYQRATVFRRLWGGSAWREIVSGKNITSAVDTLRGLGAGESTASAYEYAVVYGLADSTNIKEVYTDELANNLEISKKSTDDDMTLGARYYYADAKKIEPKNKGYLLKLPEGFITVNTASSQTNKENGYYDEAHQYYAEHVGLLDWDFNTRYLCPRELVIGIMNYNLDNKYHDVWKFVYNYDKDDEGKVKGYELAKVEDNEEGFEGADYCDVYATNTANGLTHGNQMWLMPKMAYENGGSSGGRITSYTYTDKDGKTITYTDKYGDKSVRGKTYATTNSGVLKVLRDYKHYYRVTATNVVNEVTKRDTLPLVLTGDAYNNRSDEEDRRIKKMYYAYRNITDEELAKMTMLVLADVTCNIQGGHGTGTGGSIGRPTTEDLNKPGTGTFRWSQSSGSKFCWDIRDYQHKWGKLPGYDGQMDCFIKVTDRNYDDGGAYSSDVFAKPDASRGCKSSTNWQYLTADPADHGLIVKSPEWELDKLINVTVETDDKIIPSEVIATYSGVVKFTLNSEDALFNIEVVRDDKTVLKYRIPEKNTYRDIIITWAPFRMSGSKFDKGNRESFDLGWWGPNQ